MFGTITEHILYSILNPSMQINFDNMKYKSNIKRERNVATLRSILMEHKHVRGMSLEQRQKLRSLLEVSIPELSFVEAESAIQAKGTLQQGVHAAFEPFLRSPRIRTVATAIQCDDLTDDFVMEVIYRDATTIRHLLKEGCFDWMNGDISDEHFPQKETGKTSVIMRLVNFERVISTRDVLIEFKKNGLRPANPAELLVLGAKYPSLQRQFPVIALGQTWLLPNKDRMVVCLAWHSMLRRIHLLCQFRRDWPVHCRFAAVVL